MRPEADSGFQPNEVELYQQWIQNNRLLERLVRQMRQLPAQALRIHQPEASLTGPRICSATAAS